MKSLVLILSMMASSIVLAQTTPDAQPALNTSAVPANTEASPSNGGKPEEDTPIGLFIMPWRNASAEKEVDRPARLLQADLAPIDQVVFDRQVEYYDALEAHAAKMAPKPDPK